MGVPAFFAWLSQKYPKILRDCVEQIAWAVDGTEIPPDAALPNPNGDEFDSLYLDMNGIIHPCTHPEDRPPPTTEDEMFAEIFRYIDRLMNLVRPRRLLYMAIDGVAPRAKINQQRSRRFRAAQEASEKQREEEELRKEWITRGLKVPEKKDVKAKPFDSNVITPGTPFMHRLALALREYVARRIRTNRAWKGLRVIFSDASVPGEGEHKVAEFIRQQRAQKGYDPNIRHVLYGLDADLIMLALATHEVHFTVLREQVLHGQQAKKAAARQQATGPSSHGPLSGTVAQLGGKKPFQFLSISVLREYLDFEFRGAIHGGFQARRLENMRQSYPRDEMNLQYDLERVIDDFVFLCFFVGNDFLPHLPTLDIREGALDFLIEMYKKMVPTVGYLTDGSGDVDLAKVRIILSEVGKLEDEVFAKRMEREERNRQRDNAMEERRLQNEALNKQSTKMERVGDGALELADQAGTLAVLGKQKSADAAGNFRIAAALKRKLSDTRKLAVGISQKAFKKGAGAEPTIVGEETIAQASGVEVDAESPQAGPVRQGEDPYTHTDQESAANLTEQDLQIFHDEVKTRIRSKNVVEAPVDHVRLGQQGWKDRYYEAKLHWPPRDPASRSSKTQMFRSYFEGLLWVLRYYYRGCSSWDWYYPYHYAPFASDLAEHAVSTADIVLEQGSPFRPFEQLMSVLPAVSAKGVLPDSFVELMEDPLSPIHEYYPVDFELDLNGKRHAWQAIVLLPFVDEKRLRAAIGPKLEHLSEEDRHRNDFGINFVMVSESSALGKGIGKLNTEMNFGRITKEGAGGALFGGVSLPETAQEPIEGVKCAVLAMPPRRKHIPRPINGVSFPPAELNDQDKFETERGNQGWSAARFGVLGRAASKLSSERQTQTGQNSQRFQDQRRWRQPSLSAGFNPHGAPIQMFQPGPGTYATNNSSASMVNRYQGVPNSMGRGMSPAAYGQPAQSMPSHQQNHGHAPAPAPNQPTISRSQLLAAQQAIAYAQSVSRMDSRNSYQYARSSGNFDPSYPRQAQRNEQNRHHIRFDANGNPIVYNSGGSNYNPFGGQ